ncbi:hypothetical protein [Nostoc sp.]
MRLVNLTNGRKWRSQFKNSFTPMLAKVTNGYVSIPHHLAVDLTLRL